MPRGLGVGEDGTAAMGRPGEAERPSLINAGSSSLRSGVVGHSLLRCRLSIFSVFFFSFSISLSRAFVS